MTLHERTLSPFDALDRLWERLQARWPVLYRLDDRAWKSWCWHAVIAIAVGHVIGLLPWLTVQDGMRLMVLWYCGREITNRVVVVRRHGHYVRWFFDYHWRPLDGVLDFLVPLAAVELWGRFL